MKKFLFLVIILLNLSFTSFTSATPHDEQYYTVLKHPKPVVSAIETNRLDILEVLLQRNYPAQEGLTAAVEHDNPEALKLLFTVHPTNRPDPAHSPQAVETMLSTDWDVENISLIFTHYKSRDNLYTQLSSVLASTNSDYLDALIKASYRLAWNRFLSEVDPKVMKAFISNTLDGYFDEYNLEEAKLLIDYGHPAPRELFVTAVQENDREWVRLFLTGLLPQGQFNLRNALSIATEYDDVTTLHDLILLGILPDQGTMQLAVEYDAFSVMDYLLSNHYAVLPDAFQLQKEVERLGGDPVNAAIGIQRYDLLKYVIEQYPVDLNYRQPTREHIYYPLESQGWHEQTHTTVLERAVINNDLELVRILLEHNPYQAADPEISAHFYTIGSSHIGMSIGKGPTVEEWPLTRAIKLGHSLEMIDLLARNYHNASVLEKALPIALETGNPDYISIIEQHLEKLNLAEALYMSRFKSVPRHSIDILHRRAARASKMGD